MRLPVNHALPLAALILLNGCIGGGGGAKAGLEPIATSGPAADYPVVVGAPFAIEGVTYTPADRLNFDAVGYAAVGGEGGDAVSIAHKTLPLPSYAELTSLDSGKTILVRVERRGPMTNDRLIELSPGAAAQLGISATSKAAVRIRRVNPPEIERAALRSGQRAPARMDTPQSLLTVLRRKLDPQALPFPATGPEPGLTPAPMASPSANPLPTVLPSPAATPRPRAIPIPTPRPTPRATPTPRAAPSPMATPTPRVKPSPRPTPVPVASASPRPAAGGSFVVQVGSYSNRQNAAAAAARVGGQVRAGDRISRVVMGPFANRAQAEAALAKARSAGYRDAQVQSAR